MAPLTKPEENSEAKSTIDLFRAYDANTMQPVEFKPEEPRRMSGDPAKEQVAGWIIEQYRTMAMFALAAKNGLVKAKVSLKRKNAPDTHRYTHQLEIIAKDRKRKDGRPLAFRPSLFGITEAREVVAYLESLGVKVNTNALNRV